MENYRLCQWLMENGSEVIRYKVVREFLSSDSYDVNLLQQELLKNSEVKHWIKNLKPENPTQHWAMHHGSFDFNFENAMLKAIQLGLHSGIPEVDDAVRFYLDTLKEKSMVDKPSRSLFLEILTVNILLRAGYRHAFVVDFAIKGLDELYSFCKQKIYDIYIDAAEEVKYKGLPKRWNAASIIKPEIFYEYGFGYPLIYDLIGLASLYELKDKQIDTKVDNIIEYIACDKFHEKILDGYGILAVEEDKGRSKYHSMGWDPKLPGWLDIDEYMQKADKPSLISRVLFSALISSQYPILVQTDWFQKLIKYLNGYKTERGTYCFPKEWLREQQGYAVQGFHISYGENRRKKNWCEVESTLYMMELIHNCKVM